MKKISVAEWEKYGSKSETPRPKDYSKLYAQHIIQLLENLDHEAVERFILALELARDNSKNIYLAGNGGSAATASHFTNDLLLGVKGDGKPFLAKSLSDITPVVTAIANDFGYDFIFTKQLEKLMGKGDLLVVISASGNSENLLKAVDLTKEKGGYSFGLLGFDGGKLKQACSDYLLIQTSPREYGPVEDLHLLLNHLAVSYLNGNVQQPYK